MLSRGSECFPCSPTLVADLVRPKMSMKGGDQYVTNPHVLRRELLQRQKQRRLSEKTLAYDARRNVINQFAPDKVRNFAGLEVANSMTKFEIDRPSLMHGQTNKRDPFNTIVQTEVNPMDTVLRPGPTDYSPKYKTLQVKHEHLLHSSFSSKSPQNAPHIRPHSNDTIIAAPTVTTRGLPLRSKKGAKIGSTRRDTSMIQRHRLHIFNEEADKKSSERKARLKKKVIQAPPKRQFVDPMLFGPGREQRYPADVIRGQTTTLGPGYYEPKVHPKSVKVSNPNKKSMAFLKTGRRSGPQDWMLNYIPKKDPFFESQKDPFEPPCTFGHILLIWVFGGAADQQAIRWFFWLTHDIFLHCCTMLHG